MLVAGSGCKENNTPPASEESPAAASPTGAEQPDGYPKVKPEGNVTVDEKNRPPSQTPAGTGAGSVPDDVVQRMIGEVAREAGVSEDKVVMERAEVVTWRDGSLGCPQPNMAYTQALVEGYWLVFHVGQEEFDMRVTKRGGSMRCQGATRQAPIRYPDQ